jgi:spermidine/putrescine transport system permease protein
MTSATLEDTDRRKAWGFVAPALLWTIAFFVVPFLFMAAMSLWTRASGKIVQVWNFDNSGSSPKVRCSRGLPIRSKSP